MSTDPLLALLADICRSHPTRAKWVVVPTHTIGRTLGERLAFEGTDWVNLRFVTPLGLALDTTAPFLVERGLDPLPDGLGPNLAMRLLMDLPAESAGYFRPLADQPRMGAALWAAIRELRLANVSAATLPSSAFEDARKFCELRALLAAYEEHLVAHSQADHADVYRAAAAHAADSPVASTDVFVEAADPGALPLVRAFLDSLPGQRVACAVPLVPGLELPRRLRDRARTVEPVLSRLAFLLDPRRAPSPAGRERLEIFHAAGKEAEVEGVLRRILAMPPAVPLDHVEVACASSEYASLCWEKAQRLDLPVTVEHGTPGTATRPVRALLGLCDWIDSNFVAGRLRRLFQSGDLKIEFPDGGAGAQAARLLLKSEATWGRQTYDQSLAALAARYRASATDDDELDEAERADFAAKTARVDYLREWILSLLSLIQVADREGAVSLAETARGLTTLLDGRVAVASPLDAAALTVMTQALSDLLVLGDLRRPMRQVLALVRDALDGMTVGGSRARPGHLHISSLASSGYAGRPLTFIVGLQEAGVFPSLLEDPGLLDRERQQISASLATSHDRLEEAVHAVLSRLAVLPMSPDEGEGAVCVSYSCRDLREGRETFPSWLVLQMLRLKDGNPDLTYDDLRQRLGTPETLVPARPDEALTDAGWWLATLKEAGESGVRSVLDAFPSLAAGRRAMEARDSARFTEWDGFVREARALLDPRLSGKPVSVTRIERLVECPFRYFVEHGLGVEVVADDDPDHDEWLDPLQKGSALHEVYAALGREARARGTRLDPARDAFRARRLADEILAALRTACPPPSDVVFDRERAEFLRDVELFLEFESKRPDSEPVAFELSFGHDPDGAEPLAQAEPVEVELGAGQSFLLRGTIDRIDRLPDGRYEVIDYKSGWYHADKWRGTFRGGAMLQHALYGVAAVTLLRRIDPKARVASGVYEFPSAKGGGERVEIPPPSRAAMVDVLSDLFDVMADGAFVTADDAAACTYCDFSRACGKPIAQAEAKAGDSHLEAYRKLRAHE